MWARRLRKRRAAIAHERRDPGTILLRILVPHLLPVEPDPYDRTVNKRAWERSVQDWRSELKELKVQHELS